MSGPQHLSAEAVAFELLRDDPSLDYGAVRERAAAAGVSVQPIHYGRARKQLGLPALYDSRSSGSTMTNGPDTSRIAPEIAPRAPMSAAEPSTPEEEETGSDDSEAENDTPSAPEIVAPRKKGSPAFAYIVEQLRAEPNIAYSDLRDRCAAAGFSIAPIMYGRAQAKLKLVPVKPRGKKAAAAQPAANGAPMQLRQVESVAADRFAKKLDEVRSLDQLVGVVKDLDAERRRLRMVLERVVTMIDEALGP